MFLPRTSQTLSWVLYSVLDYWTLSYVQKRSRQALSLCEVTESTYNTVVVDVCPAGSVGCVAWVPRPGFDSSVCKHISAGWSLCLAGKTIFRMYLGVRAAECTYKPLEMVHEVNGGLICPWYRPQSHHPVFDHLQYVQYAWECIASDQTLDGGKTWERGYP